MGGSDSTRPAAPQPLSHQPTPLTAAALQQLDHELDESASNHVTLQSQRPRPPPPRAVGRAFRATDSEGRRFEAGQHEHRQRWRRTKRREDEAAWRDGIRRIARRLNLTRDRLPDPVVAAEALDPDPTDESYPDPNWDFFNFEEVLDRRARWNEPQHRNKALGRPPQSTGLRWTESVWSRDSVSVWNARLRAFAELLPRVQRLPEIAAALDDVARRRPGRDRADPAASVPSRRHRVRQLDRRDGPVMLLRWERHVRRIDELNRGRGLDDDSSAVSSDDSRLLQSAPGIVRGLGRPEPVEFAYRREATRHQEETRKYARRRAASSCTSLALSSQSLDTAASGPRASPPGGAGHDRREGAAATGRELIADGALPRHSVVSGARDLASYAANADYIVSLGGPPLGELRYGIIILPIGEERLFLRADPDELIPGRFREEVRLRSRVMRRDQNVEPAFAPDVPSDYADSADQRFYQKRMLERQYHPQAAAVASAPQPGPLPPPPTTKEPVEIEPAVEWTAEGEDDSDLVAMEGDVAPEGLVICYMHVCRLPAFERYSPEELRLAQMQRSAERRARKDRSRNDRAQLEQLVGEEEDTFATAETRQQQQQQFREQDHDVERRYSAWGLPVVKRIGRGKALVVSPVSATTSATSPPSGSASTPIVSAATDPGYSTGFPRPAEMSRMASEYATVVPTPSDIGTPELVAANAARRRHDMERAGVAGGEAGEGGGRDQEEEEEGDDDDEEEAAARGVESGGPRRVGSMGSLEGGMLRVKRAVSGRAKRIRLSLRKFGRQKRLAR